LVTVNELILAWVTEILSGTAGLRSVLPKAGLAVTVTGPAMMAVSAGSAELVGTGRAERDAAGDAGVVDPCGMVEACGMVDACGVVAGEEALDADTDSAGAAAGDTPVGPAVELTVTAAGAAEVPEAVHPATSKPKAAAAANPTDVVRAVRLISICTILIVVVVERGAGVPRYGGNGRGVPAAGVLVDPYPKTELTREEYHLECH
jgi:hypothetical protein